MGTINKELERLGIPLKPGEHIFNRIINNIENIANLRKNNNASSLCLYINYLLYPGNDKEDEITRLINWADRIGLDYIKFRIPQIPQLCQNSNNHLEKGRVHELERVLQEKINSTSFTYKEVPLNDPLEETKKKPFSLCWTRFSHAVIGYDGGLYPCTSVASPSCAFFAEGNVNQASFWEIWNNPKRLLNFKHFNPKERCDEKLQETYNPAHVCTLAEFAFNQYFYNAAKQYQGCLCPTSDD
jgi:MoaA/NifB/PqqE/SkfB family radical SAM enzyme